MTEQELRRRAVSTMEGWLGWSEANGKFKAIIDLYNTQQPLPRGYPMKYTDEWCAACVTAAGISAGLQDIILPECSCSKMLELYRERGQWVEDDAYVPQEGDLILYDWEDSGTGDNLGAPNHVGMVAGVTGSTIRVIEGNKGEAVALRTLAVNGRYIRGYCLPDYRGKAGEPTVSYEQWVQYMERYRRELAAQQATMPELLQEAMTMGLTDGCRPRDLVTREEAAVMARAAAKVSGT